MTETFYSNPQLSVTVGAVGDVNLPNVVLPSLGKTIKRVYAGIKFRMIENTNVAANKLSGVQSIRVKKSTGAWGVDDVAAIDFADDEYGIAALTREGGDLAVGDNNVSSEVDVFNATYNMRWEDATADVASLVLYDVQTFLVVTYGA